MEQAFQPIEDQRALLRPNRCRRTLACQRKEKKTDQHSDAAVDPQQRRDIQSDDDKWRQDQANEDPRVDRKRSQPRRRRPLANRKPAAGNLGNCIEHKWLPDCNPDLGDQDTGIVGAEDTAQEPEHPGENGTDSNTDPNPIRVDHPRRRNRDDDEHDHEDHRQKPDCQIGDAVKLRCGAGDRRKRNP